MRFKFEISTDHVLYHIRLRLRLAHESALSILLLSKFKISPKSSTSDNNHEETLPIMSLVTGEKSNFQYVCYHPSIHLRLDLSDSGRQRPSIDLDDFTITWNTQLTIK